MQWHLPLRPLGEGSSEGSSAGLEKDLPGEGGKGRSAESASTDPSQRGKGPYAERERDEGRRGVSAMGTVRAALGAVRRLRGDHDRGDDADPEVLLCGRAPRPAHVCGPRVARP